MFIINGSEILSQGMTKRQIAAGIDIGGTNTVFGLVGREGEILTRGIIRTGDFERIEDFVATLYEKINDALGKAGSEAGMAGYGIGAPMGNINKGIMEYPSNLPWKGILPLSALFAEHTTLPVTVTNDANAAAVGEMIYGGAKGMKNFVIITLGSGLGSGFVIDGRPVYGASGFAGELGHTAVRQGSSGRICGCGRRGCLETYVSAGGIRRTVMEIMADSITDSSLRNISFNDISSKMIYQAALSGDPIALQAFEYTGKILGCKLADLVAHTDPGAIFLFGGLAEAKDLIFEPTQKYMEENLLSIYRGRVKLLPSQLSTQNAALLGAASLVWANKEI